MKKILIMMTLLALLFSAPAFAGSLTFSWAQEIVEGLKGWHVYTSTAQGGPYTLVPGDIIYEGIPGAIYQTTKVMILPVGMNYFVLTAFTDTAESGYSNETSADIPFPPPGDFTATYEVQTK